MMNLSDKAFYAKYPFMKKANDYTSMFGININDLQNSIFIPYINNAENHIKNALLNTQSHIRTIDPLIENSFEKQDIEMFSFPISILLIIGINKNMVKKKYANIEAKRISNMMMMETERRILEITKNFDWNTNTVSKTPKTKYTFTIHFSAFLKNSTSLNESKWKLINQKIDKGKIYLTKPDLIRLLENEIRKYIESRLSLEVNKFPDVLTDRINRLVSVLSDRKEYDEVSYEILDNVSYESFPPCMKQTYNKILKSEQVSHLGRFALTSFMVNIGIKTSEIVEFFTSASDFNASLTKYQVEHIAGRKGMGTKYTPPNCSTLQTHGICVSKDRECNKSVNPIICYKRKIENSKTVKRNIIEK